MIFLISSLSIVFFLDCDHCYCVDCLREWRQSKALERDVTRACPCCRMPSDYIVPSLNFCIGEEKKQVIQAYKQHLSRRECKYFNGNFGSCPFGRNCFYAHYNLQGINVKQMDVSKTKQEENQFQQNSNRSSSRTSTSNRTSTSTRLIRWFLGQEEEEEFVHPSSSIWPLYIDLYPRSYPRHDDDFFAFDDDEEEEEEEEEDLYNSDYYEHDDEEDDDEEECYYY
jgi:hypothetical protein